MAQSPSTRLGDKGRKITLIQAIGYSIALRAPTASMALNTSLAASMAGRAVPLVMLGSLVGVILMALPFIKFTRRYVHAGSIYNFNSHVLGSSTGFVSGWVLLLSYLGFAFGGIALIGDFGQALLSQLGLNIPWGPIALVGTGIVYLMITREIKISTTVALTLEGLSVLAMIILSVVIVGRGGAAHHLTALPFVPASGMWKGVAFAMVFGFLSYFGFDVAATIGEETHNPRRNIPIAILANLVLAGILYVFVSYAQTIGFGVTAEGIKTFAGTGAPLGLLADRYVGSAMGVGIDIGAVFSGFAATMAAMQAASRLLFALGRDGVLPQSLGTVSAKSGAPVRSISVVVIVGLMVMLVPSIWGTSAANMFGYVGTVGVLGFLVSYGLTSIADMVNESRTGTNKGLKVGLAILALLIILYTLYANLYPVPPMPYMLFPYLTAAWILAGVILMMQKPTLKDDINRALAAHERQIDL
ncbi:APC family permease [Sulfobacillus harzensis]|uniref:APC family permease n=1 Tax=Sulfobacillus harzensis TaxID=2729629 RepID=A0A7Y0L7V5_9FIRM|nr:APC family permease [Sulfobacillus harzensis]NMP24371.1 APC family permease [Sulfobacillus harzensis]